MPPETSHQLPHLLIRDTPSSESYRNPSDERRGFSTKERDRRQHGQKLEAQLATVERAAKRALLRAPSAEPSVRGIYIEFESDKGFDLKTESLEARKQGIELVTVREEGEEANRRTRATVFVREGKVEYFVKRVEQYLKKKTATGEPVNKPLIDSIANIRVATLKGLWTDDGEFPAADQVIWWEAWLRRGKDEEERRTILQLFRENAGRLKLTISRRELYFPESTVLLIRASADQLGQSLFILNALAEIRRAKETADFFTGMRRDEQAEWVHDLSSRVRPPGADAPAVCLLDTGVNNDHPLLVHGLSDADMSAYNPAWGNADNPRGPHRGHGTQMAGLALYGDLLDLFQAGTEVPLTHRLESVKIIPPTGANPRELYGHITSEGVSRAETNAPARNRAICLTSSTTDDRDRGQPSSWSSAVDQICSGAMEEDEVGRLVLVAAGNTNLSGVVNYPDSNETDGVHDPGQSWNAVTVGAYTEKDSINADEFPDWTPLAPKGGLSPCSTTSVGWTGTQWPFKPDVVMEGGNMARHPSLGVDFIDALQLLSTYADWRTRLLVATGDTSGATALAAGACAKVFANYPALWPETIRGLLIHSARWTPAMLSGRDPWQMSPREREVLLRKYGYGVPDLGDALYSASNSLTLIAQEHITPFVKEDSDIKTNLMHLHALPWPREALQDLGEAIVEMRVTLSYFIEPKPERKSFRTKYRYASHGLRFDMNTPTETVEQFRKRVNRVPREGKTVAETPGDSADWLLGTDLRTRGSVHSDVWHGTAADLAAKDHIAVFPVKGWWSESPHLQKWENEVRYSLIVNIKTPSVGIDIYTPVANLVLV